MNITYYAQDTKANSKWKVARLKTLMKIMSFKQGNKFAPSAPISKMLATKQEKVNWVSWFSHKLQNEIIAI